MDTSGKGLPVALAREAERAGERWAINRVESEMRQFHVAFGFVYILDLGETRFKI
jgi:hypothetical protein